MNGRPGQGGGYSSSNQQQGGGYSSSNQQQGGGYTSSQSGQQSGGYSSSNQQGYPQTTTVYTTQTPFNFYASSTHTHRSNPQHGYHSSRQDDENIVCCRIV